MKLHLFMIFAGLLAIAVEAGDSSFADYQYKQGSFREAAVEYQRMIFSDSSRATSRLKYQLAKCYYELNLLENAVSHFDELSKLPGETGLQIALLASEINIKQEK